MYLLCGEEDYLKQQYKRKLKQALLPDEDTMNFAYFEGKKTEPGRLSVWRIRCPFLRSDEYFFWKIQAFLKGSARSCRNILQDCRIICA